MRQNQFEHFEYFFAAIHDIEALPRVGDYIPCEFSPSGEKEVTDREDSYYPDGSTSHEHVLTYVTLQFSQR